MPPPQAADDRRSEDAKSVGDSVNDGRTHQRTPTHTGAADASPGAATSTDPSPRKLHEVNGHRFVAKHWNVIKKCDVCQQSLLGVGKQGYKCLGAGAKRQTRGRMTRGARARLRKRLIRGSWFVGLGNAGECRMRRVGAATVMRWVVAPVCSLRCHKKCHENSPPCLGTRPGPATEADEGA